VTVAVHGRAETPAERHDRTDATARSCTRGGHNPPVTFPAQPARQSL
jgi:hypothetical protein